MTYYRLDEESLGEIILEEIALKGDYEPLERYISLRKNQVMQTRKNDNAFPVFDNEGLVIKGDDYCWAGLSKREYFAAAALQGLLANPSITDCEMYPPVNIPEKAVVLADALIFELNKQHD